jgi:hypothetical protein
MNYEKELTYTIPVRAIKRILERENDLFFPDTFNWVSDYHAFAKELVEFHIENLQSYEEIEEFIHTTRRMSLQDWIDTLH